MRRIRLPLRPSLFFLCALLVGLVLLMPLRLVIGWLDLGAGGFAAREARGSVWLGTLAEARFGDAPLGDLSARLAPLPLLVGRARLDLASAGETAGGFAGALTVSRHRFGIDDVTARVPLGRRLMPLPVAAIDLSDVSVTFRDGLCDRADGLVKAVIEGAPAGLNLPGGLSGAARCDGGALLLPLVGQSGMESLTLHVATGGAYRADLKVQPTTPATRDALLAAGFSPVAGGYALAVTGAL
ncbi:type II secretion system protein N [Sphingomonas profundi]|uniref:type II secretion system protein N n=1 Tax=Alterirhizorhabdus profundi TaxID=2681549 RepID=UPI0012E8891A|nr:type II secretion system protein N [Sphingomonas profundi]